MKLQCTFPKIFNLCLGNIGVFMELKLIVGTPSTRIRLFVSWIPRSHLAKFYS
jgi:hypothetical protein